MKRFICAFIALCMLCTLAGAALAENQGQFEITRQFIDKLEENDIIYTYYGIQSNGFELISIEQTDSDAGISYNISVFFDPDNDSISIRIWDLIVFDPADYDAVLKACNLSTNGWLYAAYVAEDDNTVTVKVDFMVRGDNAGQICLDTTMAVIDVVGKAYTEYLGAYDINAGAADENVEEAAEDEAAYVIPEIEIPVITPQPEITEDDEADVEEPAPVTENEGQYSSTAQFIAILNERDVTYEYLGIDEETGHERLTVSLTDDNDLTYKISFFFDENNENAYIRVWNIISFDEADFRGVVEACNSCHTSWKFVTFYAEPNNTVSARIDFIFRGENAGDICLEGTQHVVSIIQKAYAQYFAPYDANK